MPTKGQKESNFIEFYKNQIRTKNLGRGAPQNVIDLRGRDTSTIQFSSPLIRIKSMPAPLIALIAPDYPGA
jgi:hypothetical protein